MQDLTIALAQVRQFWEDKEANFAHFETVLADVEADLVLLPEMFHTGFTMNAEALAEPMDNSPALRWLQQMAAKKHFALYTSFIAKKAGTYFNRGVFVLPDGSVQVYDKRKTFGLAGEDKVYSSGKHEQIVEYKGWKLNLQICYDLRFPEMARNGLRADGTPQYDVLLYVANWPERRVAHWSALLPARAIENQCYVAGVNRVGEDATGLTYSGDSVLISALGETELAMEKNAEMVGIVRLSYAELTAVREKLPFLRDANYRSVNI